MSIVQKIILWFLSLTLVPTLLVGGALYLSFHHYLVDQDINTLGYQADVQQQRVEAVVNQNKVQLQGFTSRVLLPLTLNNYDHSHKASDLALLTSSISTAKAQTPKYRDITILNLDGRVVTSTQTSAIGQDYSTKNYFAEAKVRNNSTSYLFTPAKGQLDINLVGPIMYQQQAVGIIVIDASAADLQAIISDYTGLGTTGETGLAERESNGDALYIAPLRFDKSAMLQRRVDHTQTNRPIIQAVDGQSRVLTDAVNYRNRQIIAVTRPIKGTNWGLAVETERAEVYQPLYNLRDSLLLLTFVILVFGVFIALFAARLITDPILNLFVAASAMSKGDLSQRVDEIQADDNNEFGLLAHTFNSMAGNLEQLEKMKTEFILLTSHQLRTPASAVKGFLSLLIADDAKPLDPKQREFLVGAYEENEQQLRLINQILSISQAESDQMILSKVVTNLGELIENIVDQLQPIAKAHKQKIVVQAPTKMIVMIDPEKIHMVVENLVSNAIKYSPDKTEIKVTIEQEKEMAVIRVQDYGYGIDPADRDQMFKKFSRLSNPNSVKAQGSGLGLYLVKLLVELHAGTIDVESVVGQGTTFIVRLPYK